MYKRGYSCTSIVNWAFTMFFVLFLFVLICPVASYGQAASANGRLEGQCWIHRVQECPARR